MSVSENLRGDFCLKRAESVDILIQQSSVRVLDQFSQRSKIRLELAHLIKFKPRLYELFCRTVTNNIESRVKSFKLNCVISCLVSVVH